MIPLLAAIFALGLASATPAFQFADSDAAFSAEFARQLNKENAGWKASEVAPGIFRNLSFSEAKKLMGVKSGGPTLAPSPSAAQGGRFPSSFTAMERWPHCPSIGYIRDQSACGSCWAFAAAESISDRYCTYFGASNPHYANVNISAADFMSCCESCGNGCDGGYPAAAMMYWQETGLVENSCYPYPFPKCEHHISGGRYPPCPHSIYPTPSCPSTCPASQSPMSSARRYHASNTYSVPVEQYMEELMTHGPFEVTMTVYADFEHYHSGVYRHVSGPMMGGHAIKIVGWGEENGTPYWLIANSWNSDWGEKGFFKILRGGNECGIENGGSTGTPTQAE